jgi:hypothetical protein
MGKVKRLELWWQLYPYVTSVLGLRKNPPLIYCATECTKLAIFILYLSVTCSSADIHCSVSIATVVNANAPKCFLLIIPNILLELLAYIYLIFVNFVTYLSLLTTLLLVFTLWFWKCIYSWLHSAFFSISLPDRPNIERTQSIRHDIISRILCSTTLF